MRCSPSLPFPSLPFPSGPVHTNCIHPQFMSRFDARNLIDVRNIRAELDSLLTEKLEFLTAVRVKNVRNALNALLGICCHGCMCWQLVEDVIRNHLGWLIVWGNVFGETVVCRVYPQLAVL